MSSNPLLFAVSLPPHARYHCRERALRPASASGDGCVWSNAEGHAVNDLHPAIERSIRGARTRFFIPWAAMVVAVLVLAGLGATVPGGAGAAAVPWALVAAATACAAVMLALDRRLLAPAAFASRVPAHDVELALRHLLAAHLVLWSLVAVLPLLGFAQLFLGGRPAFHLLLCGMALVILARLMPTYGRLAARIAPVVA